MMIDDAATDDDDKENDPKTVFPNTYFFFFFKKTKQNKALMFKVQIMGVYPFFFRSIKASITRVTFSVKHGCAPCPFQLATWLNRWDVCMLLIYANAAVLLSPFRER